MVGLEVIYFLLIFFIDGINSDMASTMESETEPTASSSINPDYGITNVTTQIGTNAYLPCKVS